MIDAERRGNRVDAERWRGEAVIVARIALARLRGVEATQSEDACLRLAALWGGVHKTLADSLVRADRPDAGLAIALAGYEGLADCLREATLALPARRACREALGEALATLSEALFAATVPAAHVNAILDRARTEALGPSRAGGSGEIRAACLVAIRSI